MQPQNHISRDLPDSYLARTQTDETNMPPEYAADPINAECWRLSECLALHKMQASELSINVQSPVSLDSIPIAAEALAIIARLEPLIAKMTERSLIFGSSFSDKLNTTGSYFPTLMKKHILTSEQRRSCLALMQLLHIDIQVRDVFELTCGNLDLMLILFKARRFERSPVTSLTKFLQVLADQPFKFAGIEQLLTTSTVNDLESWVGFEEETNPDFEPALDYASILNNKETSDDVKHTALVELIWSTQVRDEASLAKAMRLSFLAFNILGDFSIHLQEITYKATPLFAITESAKLWQILPSLQSSNELLMLLTTLRDRMDHDLQYYRVELGADDSDHMLLQIFEQIVSIQVTESLQYHCIEGPLKAEFVHNILVQDAIVDLYADLQILLKRQLNFAKQVKDYLLMCPLVLDRIILKQNRFLSQKFSIEIQDTLDLVNNYTDHQGWVESLIQTWASYQDKDIYYLNGAELVLVAKQEKLDILSYLIAKIFCYSEQPDIGQLIMQGTILTSLESIITQETLQSLLFPILGMVTTMVQNEMSLIRSLVEPSQGAKGQGFLLRLVKHLGKWCPAKQSEVYKISLSQKIDILLSFFECLCTTELGKIFLKQSEWQTVLMAVLYEDTPETQFNLLSNSKLDLITKSVPDLVYTINQTLFIKIKSAQHRAQELLAKYNEYYNRFQNYKLARYELVQNHQADIAILKQLFVVFQLEDGRQGLRIKFETWLDILSLDGGHYEPGYDARYDAAWLLRQRDDIFELMEMMSFMEFTRESDILMQLIQQVIESEASRDRGEGILTGTSVIVEKLKEAIDAPVSKQSYSNIKRYAEFRFLKKSRVINFHNFSKQIQTIIQRLNQTMSECQSKISDYFGGQEDGLEKWMAFTNKFVPSLQHYKHVPDLYQIISQEEELQPQIGLINMLFESANPQLTRQLHHKSFQEVVAQNQYAIGESLALMHLTEGISIRNEYAFGLMKQYLFDKQFNHIKAGFIVNGGVEKLCHFWRLFISNTPAKTLIEGESVKTQINSLAGILKSIISSARHIDKQMQIRSLQSRFESIHDLVIYLFSTLFGILDNLDVITRPGQKQLNFVVYLLLLQLLDGVWGNVEVEPEYIPSPEQITQLTMMGFDRTLAETALIMARQTNRQAFEILLSDIDALYDFQLQHAQVKQNKEKQQLEKALLMSMGPTIDFDQQVLKLQQGLTARLLQVTQTSVISPNMALLLLNHDQKTSIPDLPTLLLTRHDTFMFKVCLVMLQKGAQFTNTSDIVTIGKTLLKDQPSLFFYNVFLLKLQSQNEEIISLQKEMLMNADVLHNTKDVIITAFYLQFLTKPRHEQAECALELLPCITWPTQSEILPALFIMAFNCKPYAAYIRAQFKNLYEVKQKLRDSLGLDGDLQCGFQLSDIVTDLVNFDAEFSDITFSLQQTCLIKDKMCYLNSEPVLEQLNPNADKLVTMMLNYFQSAPNQMQGNKMPFKYYVIGVLTKMARLMPQLELGTFGKIFVEQVCLLDKTDQLQSMLVDVLGPLHGTVVQDVINNALNLLSVHTYHALSIIAALVTDVNIYETNRTIRPKYLLTNNIDILLKTQFLDQISRLELDNDDRGLLIEILREMSEDVVEKPEQPAQPQQQFWGDDEDEEQQSYTSDIIYQRPIRDLRQEIGLQGHLHAFMQHLEQNSAPMSERFSEQWTQQESQSSKVIHSLMRDKNRSTIVEKPMRQLDVQPAKTLNEAIKNRDLIEFQKYSEQFRILIPLARQRIKDELSANITNYQKQIEGDDVIQEQIELKREQPVSQPYQLLIQDFPNTSISRHKDMLESVVSWAAEHYVVVPVVPEVPVVEEVQEVPAVEEVQEVPAVEAVLQQEANQAGVEEAKLIEETKSEAEVVQAAEEEMTYGFPNSVLLEYGIEPEILHDLPEDLRQELLSTVQWRPSQPHERQQESEGLDQEFLDSLPADIRAEIVEQHRRQHEAVQPEAQPAEMDIASFIQSIMDPQMRIETLLSLSPEVVESLPVEVRAEFAQAHRQFNERAADQRLDNRGMNHVPSVLSRVGSVKTLTELNMLTLTPDEAAFSNQESAQPRQPFTFEYEWCLQLLFDAGPEDGYRYDLIGLLLRQPSLTIIDSLFTKMQQQLSLVQSLVITGVIRLLLRQRKYPLVEQFVESDRSIIEFLLTQLSVVKGALFRNYELLLCDILSKADECIIPEPKAELLLQLAGITEAEKAYQLVQGLLIKNKTTILDICQSQAREKQQQVINSLKAIDYSISPTTKHLTQLNLQSPTKLIRLTQLLHQCSADCKLDNTLYVTELGKLLKYLDGVQKLPQTFALQISNLISCAFESFVPELQSNQTKSTVIKMQVEKPSNVFKSEGEVSTGLQQLARFCVMNKELINRILDQCEGTLAKYLNYMPGVLTFKRKQKAFNKAIQELSHEPKWPVGLKISRKSIFMDAYAQLAHKSVAELQAPLKIEFTGEVGIDAGGLRRDFFIELSKAMFDPNYSLFNRTSNGVTFHPNQQSHVNPEHLNFFKFIGRFIGKSLHDGELLELHLSRPIYKMMVGEDLLYEDLEDLDNVFHQSVMWSMKEDVSELGFTFSVTRDYFGKMERLELMPNGNQVQVTNENKMQYLEMLSRYQMYDSVKDQIDAFLQGFHELIPKTIIRMFSASELDLLISGLPKVDLQDLKRNTNYVLYTQDSPQIKWLWQTLEGFSDEQMGKFLQFVTGCSRVPLAGFAELQGMQGPEKFRVAKAQGSSRLPQGHTCYNQLDLPEYETFEVLQQRLVFAISECGGFGFA